MADSIGEMIYTPVSVYPTSIVFIIWNMNWGRSSERPNRQPLQYFLYVKLHIVLSLSSIGNRWRFPVLIAKKALKNYVIQGVFVSSFLLLASIIAYMKFIKNGKVTETIKIPWIWSLNIGTVVTYRKSVTILLKASTAYPNVKTQNYMQSELTDLHYSSLTLSITFYSFSMSYSSASPYSG